MSEYKEIIIDHYKHPRNFGEMSDKSMEANEANASCGDVIKIFLKIEDGKVIKMMWQGIGCAISTAAASMLSEKVEGEKIEDVKKLKETDLVEWMGGEINPGRMKCATLAYRALQNLISKI